MHRSLFAALLSGLVFPGTGQIYLGRRRRGWIIVLITLLAVGYFAKQVLDPVMAMANQVLDGTLSPDPLAIAERLHQQGQVDNPLLTLAMVVMLVCWVGSTVDAFLLGRRQPGP
jgi:hypothetical protein